MISQKRVKISPTRPKLWFVPAIRGHIYRTYIKFFTSLPFRWSRLPYRIIALAILTRVFFKNLGNSLKRLVPETLLPIEGYKR